jgi:cobalt-zinc-cadmium resistance protein CzcA
MGTILMKSGGNGRLVSTDADKAIKDIKIPDDVQIKILYSRSYLVNATLSTVLRNLLEGAALVIVILMLILGHLRAALIVALVIPISMLWTTYGMQYFNISGNLMSLGAIDFGLVVDGAVVLVETLVASFATLTEIERRTLTKDQIVSSRARVVIKPLVFGLVMIMLVYLPIIMLEGIEGKMFRPMAFTVLMTLGFALILTIFFIPVMVSLFVKIPKPGEQHQDTWIFRQLKTRYEVVLKKMIDRPMILMGLAFILASVSGLLFTRLGTDFIPQLDEGDLVLNIARVSKISLTESVAQQKLVDSVIKKHPEVDLVFSRIGTTDAATDPMGVHLSDTFVMLKKDRKTWSVKSKEELAQKIIKDIEALGFEQEIATTQPIEMRFNEMLEGSRADVSIKVIGPDLSYLVTMIDAFKEDVKDVKGLESAEMDSLTALRKGKIIDIRPKFTELSRLGIGLDDFNQTIVTFLQGSQVGEWVQGVRKFPLIIHLAESHRESIESIRSLPVVLPDGGTVALERIADIEVIEKVTTIARNWGRRYGALSLNIFNRDTLSFVNDIRQIVKKRPVKEGHEVYLGGTFNNLEHAQKRLMVIIPLTLFLLIFILWRDLKSVKDTIMIFICVPFAAFGGVFALYFRDIHFSLSAAVGFIALIGVAHLNGIVLLTVFRQMIVEHPEKSLRDIVLEGTLSRFRPVVMTALVASIGFIPMAVNTGLGSEVQRPLASVVIGGILFSTLLTLIILPAVYLYFTEKGGRNA